MPLVPIAKNTKSARCFAPSSFSRTLTIRIQISCNIQEDMHRVVCRCKLNCHLQKAVSNGNTVSIEGGNVIAILWKSSGFTHYQVSNHFTLAVNGNPAAFLSM